MDLNVINMYNHMKICFITTIITDSFEYGDVPEIFDKNLPKITNNSVANFFVN